jgi:hypothetical protein
VKSTSGPAGAPASPDGRFWWDGHQWQPVAFAETQRNRYIAVGTAITLIVALAIAVVYVGWVHLGLGFSSRSTGAATAQDYANELTYNAVWQRDMTTIATDSEPFRATATSPGVCNAGGSKQGCYDTDARVIADLRTMLTDLSSLTVPPRYRSADMLVRQGIQANIVGLELRNDAISSGNPDASFEQSNAKLKEADADLRQAYSEFPTDNRPAPAYA